MNYGAIFAGGIGTRMGYTELPKQFLTLGSKPIIIHTLEQFIICDDIDRIIVAVPAEWLGYAEDIIKKSVGSDKVQVICGGQSRSDTLVNICKFIEQQYGMNDDDIIVTHDSVRPFVTQRIIKENIAACRLYPAADTVIPCVDTIVESTNGETITNIPVRDHEYQGQTPQTFKVKELYETFLSLNEEEKAILTDAAKIYSLKNKTVKLVMGETINIKITNLNDLKIAQAILETMRN